MRERKDEGLRSKEEEQETEGCIIMAEKEETFTALKIPRQCPLVLL